VGKLELRKARGKKIGEKKLLLLSSGEQVEVCKESQYGPRRGSKSARQAISKNTWGGERQTQKALGVGEGEALEGRKQ